MAQGKRLKIVSEGLNDLRLYDAEGNEVLKGCIRSIRWEMSAECPIGRIFIETVPIVGVEVVGEVEAIGSEPLGD